MAPLWSIWSRLLAQRPQAQRGQALMEYELVIVLVAIIVILVLVVLGQNIRDTYQFIIDSLPI